MGNYAYEYYERPDGSSPSYDFIKSLAARSGKDKQCKTLLNALIMRLTKLEFNGTRSGMPDFEHIGGKRHNLWQIRIKHATGYYRFFICQCPSKRNLFIILNYFRKDTDDTPSAEIKRAEKLMDEYIITKLGGD